MTFPTLGQWIALLAALGFGSIIAAGLSRWSVISNLRQKWIDALRDDLVAYLKEIDTLHRHWLILEGMKGKEGYLEALVRLHDSRNAAMLLYRRILLRLNMTEELHKKLEDSLRVLQNVTGANAVLPDTLQMDVAITFARQVLKQEWNRTKYGILAPTIAKLKLMSLKSGE